MDFLKKKTMTVIRLIMVLLFVLFFPITLRAAEDPLMKQYNATIAEGEVQAEQARQATLNATNDNVLANQRYQQMKSLYKEYADNTLTLNQLYDSSGKRIDNSHANPAEYRNNQNWRDILGLYNGDQIAAADAQEYNTYKGYVSSDLNNIRSLQAAIADSVGDTATAAALRAQAGENARNALGSYQKAGNDETIWCFKIAPPALNAIGCAALTSFALLKVSSFGLQLAAMVFNIAIDYTLNFKNFLTSRASIVTLGWTSFRDMVNLFFIFILLYIGIGTIVNSGTYNAKSLLAKTLICAVLINFSLFFTQALIDVSNILSLQFYNKIVVGAQTSLSKNAGNSENVTNSATSAKDSGISAGVVNALGLQDIWTLGARSSSVTGEDVRTGAFGGINATTLLLYGLGGSIFILVTAFVLGAAAFMFIIRALTLIFLMILSPVAFAGGILPSTQKYVSEWWTKLWSNLIFAPVYMALMYVVLSVVFSQAGKPGQTSFLTIFQGGATGAETALTFFVLIGLMWGCLIIATKIGASGAGAASSLGTRWGKTLGGFAGGAVGGATFGLAARTGRTVFGGTANAMANSDFMKNRSGIIGTRVLKGLRGVARASFDARNVGEVGKKLGIGAGAVGGFAAASAAKEKAHVEFGKTLGDKGQKKYAERSLRARFSASRRKAGKTLLVDSYDGMLKEHNEGLATLTNDLRSFKSNRGLKRAEELRQKGATRTAAENIELSNLQTTLSATPVKYTTFEQVDGKWKFVPVENTTAYDVTKPEGWVTDVLERAQRDAINHRVELQRQRQEAKKGQIPT